MNFLSDLGLLKILQSRRFTIAVIGAIVFFVGLQIPVVQEFSAEFTAFGVTLALALISGYSWQDAAAAGREAELPTGSEEAIREIIDSVLEAKFEAASLNARYLEDLEVG